MQIIKLTPNDNFLGGKINDTEVLVVCDCSDAPMTVELEPAINTYGILIGIKKYPSSIHKLTVKTANESEYIDDERTFEVFDRMTMKITSDNDQYYIWG